MRNGRNLQGWNHSGILCLAALIAGLGLGTARAESIVALSNTNTLWRFDSASPASATGVGITGLGSGVSIRSIDYRPSDGLLYGLGTNNQLYTLDAGTGAASLVNIVLPTLVGNVMAIDFNPVPDSNPALPPSLRIITDTGNNYRVQATPGGQASAIDTPLSYAAGDSQSGRAPTITGIGYSNNVLGATSTSLYYVDAVSNTLAFAAASNGGPNGGVLTTLGTLGIAPGVNIFDLDISGTTGVGYLVATNQFGGNLYTLNLSQTTGINNRATLVGAIDGFSGAIVGVAVVPEPSTVVMLGLGLGVVVIGVARSRRMAV